MIFHQLGFISHSRRNWEGTDDVELEAVVDQEGNAKGDGFMSLLSFIKVKARCVDQFFHQIGVTITNLRLQGERRSEDI